MIKMSSFKVSQRKNALKTFHKKKQATGIVTINVNNLIFLDRVSCNNSKQWQYILGYQVKGKQIIQLMRLSRSYLGI